MNLCHHVHYCGKAGSFQILMKRGQPPLLKNYKVFSSLHLQTPFRMMNPLNFVSTWLFPSSSLHVCTYLPLVFLLLETKLNCVAIKLWCKMITNNGRILSHAFLVKWNVPVLVIKHHINVVEWIPSYWMTCWKNQFPFCLQMCTMHYCILEFV